MKKRQLWTDIVRVFQEHKYNVTEDTLDLKMRNLKKTYRNIKDNNSKNRTGRNTVKWDYCDDFEDIFHDDKTTNFPTVLSSFPSSASSIPHISPQQTPPPLTTKTTPTTTRDSLFLGTPTINRPHPITVTQDTLQSTLRVTTSTGKLLNLTATKIDPQTSLLLTAPVQQPHPTTLIQDALQSTLLLTTPITKRPHATRISQHATNNVPTRTTPLQDIDVNQLSASEREKPPTTAQMNNNQKRKDNNKRGRALYKHRQKMIEVEEGRVNALNKIWQSLDRYTESQTAYNQIQRERNDILRETQGILKDIAKRGK